MHLILEIKYKLEAASDGLISFQYLEEKNSSLINLHSRLIFFFWFKRIGIVCNKM